MYNGIILGFLILLILLILGFTTTLLIHIFVIPIVFTPKDLVKEIVAYMGIKKGDKLYELGAGTARVGFYSSALGADVKGYEIAPIPIILLKMKKIKRGFRFKRKGKLSIQVESIFLTKDDLTDADKLYLYLNDHALKRLTPKLANYLNSGGEVYSYRYPIQDLKETDSLVLANNHKIYKYSL